MQDLRYALRSLRRTPGFTIVAAAMLALGIGANTAMYSIIDVVLLRPLPFPDPDRLFSITASGLSPEQRRELMSRESLFKATADHRLSSAALSGVGEPKRVFTLSVSRALFGVLGVRPVAGRFWDDQDPGSSASRVVISEGLWKRSFSAQPDAVGRTLTLNDKAYTVIGVAPDVMRLFRYPTIEVWIPLGQESFQETVVRLRDGVSAKAAQREIRVLEERFRQESGASERELFIRFQSLHERQTGRHRRVLMALGSAVVFVLLIAGANLAGLTIVRGFHRRPEIALRGALGAGRLRIARLLALESGLLALAGCLVGVLTAYWTTEALRANAPSIFRLSEAGLDGRVLLFTMLAGFLCALLFGLLPAVSSSRVDFNSALRASSRASGGRAGRGRMQAGLVIAETALALTLAIGAGLAMRSLSAIQPEERGYDPANKLTFTVSLPQSRYPDRESMRRFAEELLSRLRTLGGPRGAALVSNLPSTWMTVVFDVEIDGELAAGLGQGPWIHFRSASQGFFETMGTPMFAGRGFSAQEARRGDRVAIANRHLSDHYFPQRGALGQRLTVKTLEGPMEFTVIGVAEDAKIYFNQVRSELYVPVQAYPSRRLYAIVGNGGGDVTASVSKAVWAIDPALPLSEVQTLRGLLYDSASDERFQTVLMGLFAGLAVLLAAVGIHGTLAFLAARRRREFGVRLALGALPAQVVRLMARKGLLPVLIGSAIGMGGGWAGARYMESLLPGIEPMDPLVFALTPLFLVAIAALACWGPARRASKEDPAQVLRAE